ncbi:hypothetical protein MZJ28_004252 [Vibrio parahaemolyticus]|uniref:hypothetical protein n=1 Tax=Vibrio parahaemolyticus TaxID=670 RepID=UPI001864E34A|nr:hypothetical protein [Vibrio parahaemolyticus]EII3136420.1 hypothetical protein [Vibrio parahaemolyticus]EJC7095124.1 hypothetical protein [Vibrio parahaemolyticus]EJF9948181.1 hypothetical protein [Vibrio parahaemolyticus]EJG0006915.1 hypothetical protein [Vibrio parahaemolyticus]EJG0066824.1 hypothetical protein [Vibrio parahaemolyticus]
MNEQIDLLELTKERLQLLAENIIEALENAGAGRVVDKDLCEQAQYDIGKAMSEAKKLFQGNKNKFGKWREENIIGNGQRTVDNRTLTRWSSLCEFGTLEQCRKVGFTNVYKLAGKRYAGLRGKVLDVLESDPSVESAVISQMMSDFIQREKVVKEEQQSVEADELSLKFEAMEVRIAELEAENKTLRDKLASSELDMVNVLDVSIESTGNGAVALDVAA